MDSTLPPAPKPLAIALALAAVYLIWGSTYLGIRFALEGGFTPFLLGGIRFLIAGGLMFAFLLAILLIYLVLAARFESFKDPLVIMLTVPLAIAGALVFMAANGQTMNIFSQIGIIMLIGHRSPKAISRSRSCRTIIIIGGKVIISRRTTERDIPHCRFSLFTGNMVRMVKSKCWF